MIDKFNQVVSGRAVITGMLIIGSGLLFYFEKTPGATALATLAATAVNSMFGARERKESGANN